MGGNHELGNALDKAMRKAGLSNVEVAAAIGSSETTVMSWRNCKKEPKGTYLIALIRHVPGFGELLGVKVLGVMK